MDRILYRLEEGWLNGSFAVRGAFERIDEWKENLLFLLHVHQHLVCNIAEELLDVTKLPMIVSVLFTNLCEQSAQAGYGVANVLVMTLADVPRQFGQRRGNPPRFARGNSFTVLSQLQ